MSRVIFAGGDFVTGPRDVIRVIADGRKAALSIHSYLSGETSSKEDRPISLRFRRLRSIRIWKRFPARRSLPFPSRSENPFMKKWHWDSRKRRQSERP